MILVDTCIWSLALRRAARDRSARETHLFHVWRELLIAGTASLIGPVRQELLSGIANARQFELLRERVEGVYEHPLESSVWETGAAFFNKCRGAGVAADAIDMTICAASYVHGAAIFTVDPDFVRYAACLPITLFDC